jgi:hypothetical protein
VLTLNALGKVYPKASAAPSVVHECDGLDSIANLVERIEGLVNNKIRISPTPLQRKELANASNGHYIETVWGRLGA